MDSILSKFTAGFKNGYFVRIGSKSHNVFIGKDDEGRYCFEFRGRFVPVKLLGSKPLVVNQYKGDNGIISLRFSLDRPELIGCFSAFCEDLLESIENETDDSCIYKTMSSRYQAWRKLFKPNRTSLSENEIMGLLGELLFLRDHAIPQWGIDAALDSWTGLEKTHKDFSIENDWYEIKSISTGKETVRISSIEQLDSDVPGILYIYSLEKMSSSFNGVKLNAMVKELLSLFNLVQKDNLINKLETFGYDFDPAFDNYVYVVSDETAYNVTNDFPRLVRTEVPFAISKVQYDVIITEIIPYKTQI